MLTNDYEIVAKPVQQRNVCRDKKVLNINSRLAKIQTEIQTLETRREEVAEALE